MSKMIGRCSAPMPTPVSLTSITRASFCTVRRTRTCPSLVNLKALLTRLRTTSDTLVRSVMMRWPRSSGVSHSKATPGARGRPAVLARSAWRRSLNGTAETSTMSRPASRRPTCSVASISSSSSRPRASCDRLLEPREVLEAEAPVADGVQVRLGDAAAAGDAEGPRAFVEAGGDRPGQLEDLARAAHEQLPERIFVEAGAEPLREGEEDARDLGVLLLLLHGAHVDEGEGRLPRDALHQLDQPPGVLLVVADEQRPLERAPAHHGGREATAEGQRHASGHERMARSSAELDHLARTQAPDDGQGRRIADLGRAVGLDVEPVGGRQAEALALRVPEEDLH